MRSAFILSALAVIVPALGAPTFVPITKRAGPVKEHSYIVKLKEGSSKTESYDALTKIFGDYSPGSSVTYNYGDLFHGFAIDLRDNGALPLIQQLGNVEYIEPDYMMSINYEPSIDGLTPANGPVDSAVGSSLAKRGNLGEHVTIYGLDTGIYVEHSCFEGRARWGKAVGTYAEKDGHGHGTHTAGTAVGKDFGVATGAHIVSVKVLSDEGSGSISDIIAGIEFSDSDCPNKNLCILTMSLGGAPNQSLDETVKNGIARGLHFTIAAGNSNAAAETSSPARVEQANTIGAVDSDNQKASFSNYGKLIDVWAPGVNIKSAWINGPESTAVASGTSMATPYVAGVLAVALGNTSMDPPTASKELQAHAKHEVTFAPADIVAKATSTDLRAYPW